MLRKLLKSSDDETPSHIVDKKTYQTYRKTGTDLNHKILDFIKDDVALLHSAKALRMKGRGRQIVTESEDELSVLMEYMLHEYRDKKTGKNAIERYQAAVGPENEMEAELLTGLLAGYTSLFRIEAVSSKTASLQLVDLFNDEAPLTIMDINFSQSAQPGFLLFFRNIPMECFNKTSGTAFVFPSEEENFLLKESIRLRLLGDSPRAAAKRFQRFFRWNRQRGIETIFV